MDDLIPEEMLNPDVVSILSQQFDYLSLKDRIAFMEMVNSIPGLTELPFQVGEKYLKVIFNDRAALNSSIYDSKVLENTLMISNKQCNYKFSAIYPKNSTEPTIKEHLIPDIFDPSKNFSLQKIIRNGLIWSLTGLSGRISYSGKIFNIYCHDRELYMISCAAESTEIIIWEMWFKNNIRYMEGDLPAEIFRYSDTGHISMEMWYVDGKIGRADDKPAILSYNDNKKGSWLKEAVWFVDGNLQKVEEYYKDGTTKS